MKNKEEFLEIYIETSDIKKISQNFKQKFLKAFYEIFKDFAFSIQKKWIKSPDIHFVLSGTIPRVKRTKKIQLIDDRRKKTQMI